MEALFILVLSAGVLLLLLWGFRRLPGERWQFIASVPLEKTEDQSWKAVNFTYYGFFFATACTFAVTILFLLLGSVSIPVTAISVLAVAILAVCIPASSIMARIVEGKRFTFTVGGASFIGIVVCPLVIIWMNHTFGETQGYYIPPVCVLAAASVAYAFGEGIGRLACISFGCCYGKPIADVHPLLQRVFQRWHFIFQGRTKKVVYAGNLEGMKVVPVQALTAVIDCTAGIAGVYLFLEGLYLAAFLGSLVVTQSWRVISEFLRADYRGGRKISAYQILSIVGIVYSVIIAVVFPVSPGHTASITAGLIILWNPAVILFLQVLWVLVFLHTGRSMVTGSTVSFHVVKDRI